ncbi:hypothetical protein VNO77_08894 [Canavalia gladiata]|uniref:Uncharacterized protein n=1 Tax=Canavalia gladiata TaxID=3824 RepID=A0AAN9QX62_CANGL
MFVATIGHPFTSLYTYARAMQVCTDFGSCQPLVLSRLAPQLRTLAARLVPSSALQLALLDKHPPCQDWGLQRMLPHEQNRMLVCFVHIITSCKDTE